MKRFLSVLLVLTLVFLCGCSAKEDATDSQSNTTATTKKPIGFAATTVLEDNILTFRVLSETPTNEGGISYNLDFKNNSSSDLTVTLTNVTLNKQKTAATVSLELPKGTTKNAALVFAANDVGSKQAAEVGVHLKATGKKDQNRWYIETLSEHDLIFYPIAP